MVRVLFAAGGTGGHLFPALEIAEELSDHGIDCSFAAFGLSTSRFFPHGKWNIWETPASRISCRPMQALSFCWNTTRSTWSSCHMLKSVKPCCVIGFGSYHTVPVLAAAVLRRVPLFLFEPNAAPGRVIRLFSRYAHLTGICFEKTKSLLHSDTELVAMPLLKSSTAAVEKHAALHRYGFSGDLPVVVAFGGSQGSSVINQTIMQAVHLFDRQKKPNLLLLCGQGQDRHALEKMAQHMHVMARVIPFEKEMAYAYAVGDLFVSRSGASSVAELAAIGKPAILIPYPHAKDDHQLTNARELEATGQALILKEADLTPERLCTALFCQLRNSFRKEKVEKRKQFSEIIRNWISEEDAKR